MQHSCGSARCQRSCVGTSPPHHLRPRSSKVEFNRAAIPPGLVSLRLDGSASQSLSGSQDTARWAVGADYFSHPVFLLGTSPQSKSLAACHRLRGTPASASQRRASIRRFLPVREDRHLPHQRRCSLTPLGRSGPGPGGRLPTRAAGLCRRPGAYGLPSVVPPKPASPHTSRPPPGPTLRFASRPWSFRDSKAGSRIKVGEDAGDIARATVQPLRL